MTSKKETCDRYRVAPQERVEAEKERKGMVKKPFLFLLEPLKTTEFKRKLSVVEARKEPNELSRTILPECCLPGKGSSGKREYWGSQSGKEALYLSCLRVDL